MNPTPSCQRDVPSFAPILAFGAHPDDIEFGCGGVIAGEGRRGRKAHFVVCSRGEAGSSGDGELREAEARKAAAVLGATVQFVDLGGDAHFEYSSARALALAKFVRRIRPAVVLSPAPVPNQHPDHAVLGRLVRDAARLARYAGVEELKDSPPCAIGQMLFYAMSVEGEPEDVPPVFVDVSGAEVMEAWKAAMAAHASQMRTRNYVELQLTRARLNGLRAGVEYAIALFPSDPIVVGSIEQLGCGARRF